MHIYIYMNEDRFSSIFRKGWMREVRTNDENNLMTERNTGLMQEYHHSPVCALHFCWLGCCPSNQGDGQGWKASKISFLLLIKWAWNTNESVSASFHIEHPKSNAKLSDFDVLCDTQCHIKFSIHLHWKAQTDVETNTRMKKRTHIKKNGCNHAARKRHIKAGRDGLLSDRHARAQCSDRLCIH